MVGPRFAAEPARYSNMAFGSQKFSNEQIENAARYVQTAAELTRYRVKDTAVAALPYVS
jgi:hypothetical protein